MKRNYRLVTIWVSIVISQVGYSQTKIRYSLSNSEAFLNSSVSKRFETVSQSRMVEGWGLTGYGAAVGGVGLLVSDTPLKEYLLVTHGILLVGGLAILSPLGGGYGSCGPGLQSSSVQKRENCLNQMVKAQNRQQLILSLSFTTAAAIGTYLTLVKPASSDLTYYTDGSATSNLELQWVMNFAYAVIGLLTLFEHPDQRDLDTYNNLKSKKVGILSTTSISLLPMSHGTGLAASLSF